MTPFIIDDERRSKLESWARTNLKSFDLYWIAKAITKHKQLEWGYDATTYGALSCISRHSRNPTYYTRVRELMHRVAKQRRDSSRWWFQIPVRRWIRLSQAERNQIEANIGPQSYLTQNVKQA